MHYIGLLLLALGFIGLGQILVTLYFCGIVEAGGFDKSDMCSMAHKHVKALGGPFRARIFCCWISLPASIMLLGYGYMLSRLFE